ncbi:hypothetical protein M408DRAFT_330627 [Serendipita vermifera MAFF 305830]|uniref:Uncharacterized protein n=1 Tax=Serendipita vermifera MAFF 305830 TaxID=933852 RepID=A0A0C2WJI4_SERVB|nr:hypothetical protein M408DRAFT_330627 [Serendipita vermifera MAFF 305830]
MDAGFVPSIKCVLIGDYEVGKTSLINAFATREPLNQYFPGLTGPVQIHIEHAFRLYLLHVHDTEGAHAPTPKTTPATSPSLDEPDAAAADLSELSVHAEISSDDNDRSYSGEWISRRVEYGLADVVLICFSLANRASFENVANVWRREIEQFCPHIPFIVIGCKLDLRRPDPTTPVSLPSRSQPSSYNRLQLRRPKPARSSTASTSGSTAPGSPSISDFGHNLPESSVSRNSVVRPVSILTNSPTPAARTHTELSIGSSSAPASDAEQPGKKLKAKSSFPIPFPGVKAFRRKSVTDASSSVSRAPSSFSQLDIRPPEPPQASHTQSGTSASAPAALAATSPTSPTTTAGKGTLPPPKSPRYPNMPPFIRSISHANVFRKVLTRSRSGSRVTNSPTDTTSANPSTNPSPVAHKAEPPSRPVLPHRFTSGSADDSSVRKLHSHVRTSSQPSPTAFDDKQLQMQVGSGGSGSAGVAGEGRVVGGGLQVGIGMGGEGGGSTTSSNPRPSPAKKVTRIEEPPASMRHRTTTYQEARSTARRLGASGYMECSSLTLVNVVKVFDEAVRIAVERRQASASSLHGHRRRGRNEECVAM